MTRDLMGFWRWALLGSLVAGAVSTGCKGGDTKSAKYWVAKVKEEHTEKEKRADLGHLRNVLKADPKQAGAALEVSSLLKDQPGDVIQDSAEILSDLGDKVAVPALVDAVDLSRGAGADRATEEANHANKAIAEALGAIGSPAGTPGLVRLLKSKDNYTLLAAIDALGKIKDPASVDALSQMAADPSAEPLITKNVVLALGNIGDPKAIPAVHQLLFRERTDRGISFFAESSFAMFQIGKPASEILLNDVKGGSKEFRDWAHQNNVLDGAILAKDAQLLGDLAETRAEPDLIKLLGYKDDNPALQLFTRVEAADSLARMRIKAAVKPISELLDGDEANGRMAFTRGLDFIGDRSAIPALVKSAKTGSISARQYSYKGIALLGDGEKDLKAYDDLLKDEEGREKAECKTQEIGDADCADQIKKNMAMLKGYRAALTTRCQPEQEACWQGLLDDKNVFVRQRAALEVGRSGKAEAVPALFAVVQKPLDAGTTDELTDQDDARFAAIMGLHWLLDAGVKVPNAADLASKLEAQVEVERKKTATQRSAEDVKRLAVRFRRLAS